MRALSIRQPFVEMIFTDAKKVEYRSKKTLIRGKFYIYSSKKVDKGLKHKTNRLPTGVIVGTAELVDCIPYWLDIRDMEFGYPPDGYGWILKNPKRLKRYLKPTKKPQPVWFNPF